MHKIIIILISLFLTNCSLTSYSYYDIQGNKLSFDNRLNQMRFYLGKIKLQLIDVLPLEKIYDSISTSEGKIPYPPQIVDTLVYRIRILNESDSTIIFPFHHSFFNIQLLNNYYPIPQESNIIIYNDQSELLSIPWSDILLLIEKHSSVEYSLKYKPVLKENHHLIYNNLTVHLTYCNKISFVNERSVFVGCLKTNKLFVNDNFIFRKH